MIAFTARPVPLLCSGTEQLGEIRRDEFVGDVPSVDHLIAARHIRFGVAHVRTKAVLVEVWHLVASPLDELLLIDLEPRDPDRWHREHIEHRARSNDEMTRAARGGGVEPCTFDTGTLGVRRSARRLAHCADRCSSDVDARAMEATGEVESDIRTAGSHMAAHDDGDTLRSRCRAGRSVVVKLRHLASVDWTEHARHGTTETSIEPEGLDVTPVFEP